MIKVLETPHHFFQNTSRLECEYLKYLNIRIFVLSWRVLKQILKQFVFHVTSIFCKLLTIKILQRMFKRKTKRVAFPITNNYYLKNSKDKKILIRILVRYLYAHIYCYAEQVSSSHYMQVFHNYTFVLV